MSQKKPQKPSTAKPTAQAKPLNTAGTGLPLWVYWVGIPALTFLVFGSVLSNEFVNLDDDSLIYQNPMVLNGQYLDAFRAQFMTADWKPLVLISWMTEVKLFGANAAVFHGINLLYHALNALLVFSLARKIFAWWNVKAEDVALVSFFAALLFALHPLRVESVAWAVEREDLQFGAFYLTGLLLVIRYFENGQSKWAILAGACWLAAMLSKSMAVTFPAAVLLLHWAKYGPQKAGKIFYLLAGLAVLGILTLLLISNNFATKVIGIEPFSQPTAMSGMPLLFQFILTAAYRLDFFLLKMLVPYQLSPMTSKLQLMGDLGPFIYALPIVFVGILAALWALRNRFHWGWWGICWFVACLSPALLAPAGGVNFLAERYTYMASVGFSLAVVMSVFQLSSISKSIKIALTVALVGAMAALSYARCPVWNNSMSLYNDVLSKYPGAIVALHNRALLHQQVMMENQRILATNPNLPPQERQRLTQQAREEFQLALQDFNGTVAGQPDFNLAVLNRGNLFFQVGDYDAAYRDFSSVISKDTTIATAYSYRGAVYAIRGQNTRDTAALAMALQDLERAIALDPSGLDAVKNKAAIHYMLQQWDKTADAYNHYLGFYPNDVDILYLKSEVLMRLNRYQEIIQDMDRALSQNPANPERFRKRKAEAMNGKG